MAGEYILLLTLSTPAGDVQLPGVELPIAAPSPASAETPPDPARHPTLALAPAAVVAAITSVWDAGSWDEAAIISRCESGWNAGAHRLDAREDSRGLFQINVRAHPWAMALDLWDPRVNSFAAALVYQRAGHKWTPWLICAYRAGLTRGWTQRELDAARAAGA